MCNKDFITPEWLGAKLYQVLLGWLSRRIKLAGHVALVRKMRYA
jgi:hypothetical protein